MSSKIIGYTSTWEPKTWNGLTSFDGDNVWTDGTDIYYSNSDDQYILDKATGTWEPKTWNGVTNVFGEFVWTDGTDIYYSGGSSTQYRLNKATSTWESKTWNGFTDVYAAYVWTDGTDIYYSFGTDQYKLNRSTSTWEHVIWNGFTNVAGSRVWTDGTDVYYSANSSQYKLDKATSTWEPKTWNGWADFYGDRVWTDGTDVYYSMSSEQYKIDKATSTLEPITWNGLTSFGGNRIWTDGTDIYYSDGSYQYVLVREPIYGEDTSNAASLKVKDKNGNWVDISDVSVRTHGGSAQSSNLLLQTIPCYPSLDTYSGDDPYSTAPSLYDESTGDYTKGKLYKDVYIFLNENDEPIVLDTSDTSNVYTVLVIACVGGQQSIYTKHSKDFIWPFLPSGTAVFDMTDDIWSGNTSTYNIWDEETQQSIAKPQYDFEHPVYARLIDLLLGGYYGG